MSDLFSVQVSLASVVLAVSAFGLKHLLADYFLQTNWMARGKGRADHWLLPLAAHAGVHALGTLILALLFAPGAWWLALVDLGLHATIDRLKALGCAFTRWRPDQPAFWWAFGLDQEAHALTHLAFVVVLATAG